GFQSYRELRFEVSEKRFLALADLWHAVEFQIWYMGRPPLRRSSTRRRRSSRVRRSTTAATAAAISRHRSLRSPACSARGCRPPPRPAARLDARNGALHGAEDGPHRHLFGRPIEAVATGGTAPRLEKAGAFELQEHLLQIPLGNALAGGDLLDRLEPFLVVQRE